MEMKMKNNKYLLDHQNKRQSKVYNYFYVYWIDVRIQYLLEFLPFFNKLIR